MGNVLLVTRNFPPTSHVSVERATKLAKYLPEFGWCPTVLTGTHGTAGLPQDPSLLRDVAGVEIIRARAPELSIFYHAKANKASPGQRGTPKRGALHPKAWLIPDSQILWYPFALRAALRRARSARWDVVVATSFPPTTILIAHTIAARLGIPYVADFRDGWTTSPLYHVPTRPAPIAELERRLEARMVRDAAAVVTVDATVIKQAFARLAPGAQPPMYVIQNGYDEDDFRDTPVAELPRFSIVHTGQLRRSLRPLWAALSQAIAARPELSGRMHFWQIGFVDPRATPDMNVPPAGVVVHHIPPVPQREAISYMLGADLLFVEEFDSIMPSKTLQYLRAGRPLLALLEAGGVIRDVLQTIPQAHLVPREDTVQAGALIAALACAPRVGHSAASDAVVAYSRREIARRFAAVLDKCKKPTRGDSHRTPEGTTESAHLGSCERAGEFQLCK